MAENRLYLRDKATNEKVCVLKTNDGHNWFLSPGFEINYEGFCLNFSEPANLELVYEDDLSSEEVKQWDLPPELRETGFECLALHRGKWRHVCWSSHGWSLGYGQPVMIDVPDRHFANLPDTTEDGNIDFYGWKE